MNRQEEKLYCKCHGKEIIEDRTKMHCSVTGMLLGDKIEIELSEGRYQLTKIFRDEKDIYGYEKSFKTAFTHNCFGGLYNHRFSANQFWQ